MSKIDRIKEKVEKTSTFEVLGRVVTYTTVVIGGVLVVKIVSAVASVIAFAAVCLAILAMAAWGTCKVVVSKTAAKRAAKEEGGEA